MDRNPTVTDVLTRDRIADLFATASNSRARRGEAVSVWRKLTGAALVRLGVAILGESRTPTGAVSLAAASLSR